MARNIHPKSYAVELKCSTCGATFNVKSTKESFQLDVCSVCHPFYTGKKVFLDTAGRVEKFMNKYKKK